jgi:hypothetical protein
MDRKHKDALNRYTQSCWASLRLDSGVYGVVMWLLGCEGVAARLAMRPAHTTHDTHSRHTVDTVDAQ